MNKNKVTTPEDLVDVFEDDSSRALLVKRINQNLEPHMGHGYLFACPDCGFEGLHDLVGLCDLNFCPNCGRKLDWSDIEDWELE